MKGGRNKVTQKLLYCNSNCEDISLMEVEIIQMEKKNRIFDKEKHCLWKVNIKFTLSHSESNFIQKIQGRFQ